MGCRSLGFRNSITPNYFRYAQEVRKSKDIRTGCLYVYPVFDMEAEKENSTKHLQTLLNVYIMKAIELFKHKQMLNFGECK